MGINLKKLAKQTEQYEYVLIVMRHAKAEPFNEKGDHERTLTEKGLKQAKTVSKGLARLDMIPDRIACSSARRAQETLEKMLKTFGDHPKVDYRQSLYDAGIQSVLDEIEQTKDKHHRLMILGHEPTVSVSCQWLADSNSDPAMLDLLNLGLSTAAIVVFGSHEPFSTWKIHSEELIGVINPKDFD